MVKKCEERGQKSGFGAEIGEVLYVGGSRESSSTVIII